MNGISVESVNIPQ